MKNKRPVWAVIPAAGVGKRMQSDTPKQYLQLAGKSVIEHTIHCFLSHSDVAGIVVALHPDDPYWKELSIDADKPIHTVAGGSERSDSVLNALIMMQQDLKLDDDTWVMVHDAARPCLSQLDLDKLLSALKDDRTGGILAIPVRDTMKRTVISKAEISHTEDREGLWHALTPQMFPLGLLQSALSTALEKDEAVTDDASAIELAGLSPKLIEGDSTNIKITRPSDLALAEFFLMNQMQQGSDT